MAKPWLTLSDSIASLQLSLYRPMDDQVRVS